MLPPPPPTKFPHHLYLDGPPPSATPPNPPEASHSSLGLIDLLPPSLHPLTLHFQHPGSHPSLARTLGWCPTVTTSAEAGCCWPLPQASPPPTATPNPADLCVYGKALLPPGRKTGEVVALTPQASSCSKRSIACPRGIDPGALQSATLGGWPVGQLVGSSWLTRWPVPAWFNTLQADCNRFFLQIPK